MDISKFIGILEENLNSKFQCRDHTDLYFSSNDLNRYWILVRFFHLGNIIQITLYDIKLREQSDPYQEGAIATTKHECNVKVVMINEEIKFIVNNIGKYGFLTYVSGEQFIKHCQTLIITIYGLSEGYNFF